MNFGYDYSYSYPVESSISDSAFAAILSFYLIVLAVIFIVWITEYIFRGVGLYTIAKRMGREYPWLAFIPFARDYLHGELAEVIGLKTRCIKNPGIWKLVFPIISGVVFGVFYIIFIGVLGVGMSSMLISLTPYGSSSGIGGGTIALLFIVGVIWILVMVAYKAVYKVLCVLIDFQIFGKFTSRNMAIAHGVLSSVIPLYEAICLFVLRNRPFNPGMEPRLTPPPAPIPPVPPVPPIHPEQFAAQSGPQKEPVQPEHRGVQTDPAAPSAPVPPEHRDVQNDPVPPAAPMEHHSLQEEPVSSVPPVYPAQPQQTGEAGACGEEAADPGLDK